jgi:hypothetical protein
MVVYHMTRLLRLLRLVIILGGPSACATAPSPEAVQVEGMQRIHALMDMIPPPRIPRLTFGKVVLCRDAILSADIVEAPDLALTVRVTEQARRSIEEETSALVGKRIPIALNNLALYEVTVNEPITGGNLLLFAHSKHEANSMKTATQTPCPL